MSNTCFLSAEIASAIAGNLTPEIDEETGELIKAKPVDFSFVVSMVAQESAATGYIYRYSAQMELDIDNPLTAFLKKLPPLPPAKTTKAWEGVPEDTDNGNDFEKIADNSGASRKKAVKKKGRKKK